ncbi:MAG: hypothetical protein ACFFAH_12965 [Promethearchaeota archaeon]
MEVLELKSLKNKNISVYLIEKPIRAINMSKIQCLVKFLTEKDIKFITIDMENENLKDFKESNLGILLEKLDAPYYSLDIPEYAKGYLFNEILEKEEQVDELLTEYSLMKNQKSFKGQNLKCWIEMLEDEVRQKIEFYSLKLRPQWITKKILDIIKSVKSEEICFVHFAKKDIFLEMASLFKELDIEVIAFNKKENVVAFNIITNQEEIEQWKF